MAPPRTYPVLLLTLLLFCLPAPSSLLASDLPDSIQTIIAGLDIRLDINSDDSDALLRRGRALLEAGRLQEARTDFRRLCMKDDPKLKIAGFIGLGDTYRRMKHRNLEALKQYMIAQTIDPYNKEVQYAIGLTGLALQETSGHIIASKAFKKIICVDPEYRDAYELWRTRILGHTDDELQEVDACLEGHLKLNPQRPQLWLDLAADRFRVLDVSGSLRSLESLDTYAPDYKTAERLLLEARCRLDREDTLGFCDTYYEAVSAARTLDDFKRLLLEAETIFTPGESKAVKALTSARGTADFLRVFWKQKDPDPLTSYNERLVEHYRRLRDAETYYRMKFPDSRFQRSRDYFTLRSPRLAMSITGLQYEYKPEQFVFGRNRELMIDQRGLMLVRHGQPYLTEEADINFDMPYDIQVWWYGGNSYTFINPPGIGDYVLAPDTVPWTGDYKHALETESFEDMLKELKQSCYGVDFMAADGGIDLDLFQSVPVGKAPLSDPPVALAAVFDSLLVERDRDSTVAARSVEAGGDTWLGVSRLHCGPGKMSFALKFDIPGVRCVERKNIELKPYSRSELSLSGVVEGTPSAGRRLVYSRRGISLVPRPSQRFTNDETVAVYFEIYSLGSVEGGDRAYTETVTISRVTHDQGRLASLIEKLRLQGRRTDTHRTLQFDRRSGLKAGPVPEYFTVDTSELVPGIYTLTIIVTDSATGEQAGVTCSLLLTDS